MTAAPKPEKPVPDGDICTGDGEANCVCREPEPIDALAPFNMKVDDLVSKFFDGIDDYIHRHPEITDDIAKHVLETRACDMAEAYVNWVEEGDGEWNGIRG